MNNFDLFLAVDWSGANSGYRNGLAVAGCEPGNGGPFVIRPEVGPLWTRKGIIKFLNETRKTRKILCGFDFSFAAPFLDKGEYFPKTPIRASNAHGLWRAVENLTDHEPDLYAGSLVRTEPFRQLFQYPKFKGARYEPRLRKTELACHQQKLGRAETFFKLIGLTQVGVGSLSGMRALLRFENFAIWPFMVPASDQSVVVEIYTRIFLTMGGEKIAKVKELGPLNKVLENLQSKPFKGKIKLNDHICDALASAAGLRLISEDQCAWSPEDLNENVRKTEGWTFGVF